MPYTVPQFNVFTLRWDNGHTPAADPPDSAGDAQFYVNSRIPGATDQIPPTGFRQTLSFRWPAGDLAAMPQGTIYEMALAMPGFYWIVTSSYPIHVGFPNEYLVAVVCPCDNTGTPLANVF